MAFSVVMPALEMAQETGKLIAWRKKEGEPVTKGEPLLEVETDKAVLELEAPADGILVGITATAGTDVPVGRTIAWILAPGEQPPPLGEPVAVHSARAKSPAAAGAPAPPEPSTFRRPKISPKARRLAQELGVEVATLQGSGPGGEIFASDVQAAASKTKLSSTDEKIADRNRGNIEVPTAVGRIMAERTTESWTTVPHFFVTREIQAEALNAYRERVAAEIERSHQIRPTHTDLLVALAARALLKHPRLNASWSEDGIRLHDHVNMGVAIAVEGGVVAAVIPDAHTASLAEIAKRRRDVAERARSGKLRPADIVDATFTISNLGMYGVDSFTAIIMPPQAAVLAVGAISDRIVAVEGKPAVCPVMTLTLSSDHRVVDGACAATFLQELSEAIHHPGKLLG